jgi:Putative zinc-finger
MASVQAICHPELIAAYVDGDLESSVRISVEQHLLECEACEAELRNQRLLACELDSLFAEPALVPVPRDFARVVAAQAECDMSGARTRTEHKRAFRYCLILAFFSFALLGVATSKALLFSGQLLGSKVIGLIALAGKALYDAGTGFTVIMRVAAKALMPDGFSVLVLLVLLLAIVLLSLLISGYHRFHRRGLYE